MKDGVEVTYDNVLSGMILMLTTLFRKALNCKLIHNINKNTTNYYKPDNFRFSLAFYSHKKGVKPTKAVPPPYCGVGSRRYYAGGGGGGGGGGAMPAGGPIGA